MLDFFGKRLIVLYGIAKGPIVCLLDYRVTSEIDVKRMQYCIYSRGMGRKVSGVGIPVLYSSMAF